MSPIVTSTISALGAVRGPSSTVNATNAGDTAISFAAKRPLPKRRRQSYICQHVAPCRRAISETMASNSRRRSAPSPRRNVADARSDRCRRSVGPPSRRHPSDPRASIIVDSASARPRGGALEPVAAVRATHQSLHDPGRDGAPQRVHLLDCKRSSANAPGATNASHSKHAYPRPRLVQPRHQRKNRSHSHASKPLARLDLAQFGSIIILRGTY